MGKVWWLQWRGCINGMMGRERGGYDAGNEIRRLSELCLWWVGPITVSPCFINAAKNDNHRCLLVRLQSLLVVLVGASASAMVEAGRQSLV